MLHGWKRNCFDSCLPIGHLLEKRCEESGETRVGVGERWCMVAGHLNLQLRVFKLVKNAKYKRIEPGNDVVEQADDSCTRKGIMSALTSQRDKTTVRTFAVNAFSISKCPQCVGVVSSQP